MINQSLNSLKGLLFLSSALVLAACGGGGGGNPGSRSAQNIVYINDTDASTVMAARDDRSTRPFGLITVNGGTVFGLSVAPDSPMSRIR